MCFFTIFVMYTLCGAEIDLFVPSFPELQKVFNLSPFMVELTLGVNLVAHCLTSLFLKPLTTCGLMRWGWFDSSFSI